MGRRHRTAVGPAQIGFGLGGEAFEGPAEATGVFSLVFLSGHLPKALHFANQQAVLSYDAAYQSHRVS